MTQVLAPPKKVTANGQKSGSGNEFPAWTTNALAVGLILAFIAAWVQLGNRIGALEVEVGKVKQSIADGGTHEIVSQLDKATTAQQVAANMTVIRGKVQLALSEGKPPNQQQISVLAPALVKAAKRFPEIPDTWETVAKVASFRTASYSSGEQAQTLPDCHADKAELQILYPSQIPEFQLPPHLANVYAYLFRNCTLHLNRLPGHSTKSETAAASPFGPAHTPFRIGNPAYAVNCIIVLDDEGISDTSIVSLEMSKCHLEFNISRPPPIREQTLLLEALVNSTPGNGQFSIQGQDS